MQQPQLSGAELEAVEAEHLARRQAALALPQSPAYVRRPRRDTGALDNRLHSLADAKIRNTVSPDDKHIIKNHLHTLDGDKRKLKFCD